MHAWETIQEAIDDIEENLNSEISAEQLAQKVALSPFYFQRLFKRLVHKSMQQYIKLRRLAKAAEDLAQGEQRILDVAVKYGFSSHASFTRSFKEAYGLTPEEYRKTKPPLNTMLKPDISMSYTLIDEGVPLIVNGIVLEIERKRLSEAETYIGLTTAVRMAEQVPIGESTGVDAPGQLWSRFHAYKEAHPQGLDPVKEFGMCYEANPAEGSFTYFTGALAQGDAPDNDSLQTASLPAGEYIVCKIEAESFQRLVTEALDKASKYLYDTWLPRHKINTAPFCGEKYYKDSEQEAYMEIWIESV